MLEKLYKFCIRVDLTVILRQLGVTEVTEEKIRIVAEAASKDTLINMPFDVIADDTYSAIITADKLGEYYLSKGV